MARPAERKREREREGAGGRQEYGSKISGGGTLSPQTHSLLTPSDLFPCANSQTRD